MLKDLRLETACSTSCGCGCHHAHHESEPALYTYRDLRKSLEPWLCSAQLDDSEQVVRAIERISLAQILGLEARSGEKEDLIAQQAADLDDHQHFAIFQQADHLYFLEDAAFCLEDAEARERCRQFFQANDGKACILVAARTRQGIALHDCFGERNGFWVEEAELAYSYALAGYHAALRGSHLLLPRCFRWFSEAEPGENLRPGQDDGTRLTAQLWQAILPEGGKETALLCEHFFRLRADMPAQAISCLDAKERETALSLAACLGLDYFCLDLPTSVLEERLAVDCEKDREHVLAVHERAQATLAPLASAWDFYWSSYLPESLAQSHTEASHSSAAQKLTAASSALWMAEAKISSKGCWQQNFAVWQHGQQETGSLCWENGFEGDQTLWRLNLYPLGETETEAVELWRGEGPAEEAWTKLLVEAFNFWILGRYLACFPYTREPDLMAVFRRLELCSKEPVLEPQKKID